MFQYSDKELLEGLRQRKRSSIDCLYRELYPIVRHYLLHNSGNIQDGEDLFHDTLIAMYQRISVDSFVLECSLKTYFMAICKNIWLQRLERKYKVVYQGNCEVHEQTASYTMDDPNYFEEELEQQRLFYKNLMLLPNECIRLLQLYCLKISYKEIARLLKYKSEFYVKTRKYSCKNLLRKKIINDPECNQFIKSNGT
jgi:RNA polymerase sigma factor (sigma-70 family)